MSRSTRAGAAVGITVALTAGLVPAFAATAYAHPEQKHGPSSGHLPGQQRDVRLVGEAQVTPRPSATPTVTGQNPLEGRVADVNVFGDYAYLAAFNQPTCENGGVFVVDVTDPTQPVEVPEAFIPTTPGSFVGEGVQVLEVGALDVLLFNNEICNPSDPRARGGLTMVDVTDPRSPVVLAANVGDTTGNATSPTAVTPVHQIHSVFGWNDDGRSYAVLVDDDEARDIDILDITDPTAPVLVSETSLRNDPRVVQPDPPNGDSQFFHDVQVKEVDGVQTMLASYWDNGYVILDVEDPANPVFQRDTDFEATEPFAAELGLPAGFEPEGNAHQAEFSPDNELFIGTDEDFGPFRVVASITSGPRAGTEFTASQGSGGPNVDEDRSIAGATVYGGFGCDPASVPQGTAEQTVLIERGAAPGSEACTFQVKYDNALAKGFGAVVVFNNERADCQGLVNPAVVESSTVPFIFVNRADGLAILGQQASADPCTQDSPAAGTAGSDIDIRAVFDGWGYVHLYDAQTMQSIDEYAIPESLDADFAEGYGDLSVHEVAMDPDVPGRAYLSYYAGGFRVVEFDRTGITEVGAYVDPAGSNHWGVEHWTSPTTGQSYVLASDRDFGLQIFQYDASLPDVTATITPDPLPAEATTATVSGTVSSTATVTVEVSLRDEQGASSATRTVTIAPGGNGAYSVDLDVTGLAAGTLTATVRAVDASGGVGVASDTVVKLAPAPAAPAPAPGGPGASPAPTASPSVSPSPTTSPSPTGSASPVATPAQCAVPTRVTLDRSTIVATGSAAVTVTTAPNSIIDLYAYTRPATTYRVVRSAEVSGTGTTQFRIVPPANTRLYAQVRGCPTNAAASTVLNVRTALSLFATRTGERTYRFTGDSLPARRGGLIVSLYRVTANGSQVLTAQTRASATTGQWTINRRFTGEGRFGFVVRTGQDLQNAPGASNVRPTLVF